jgi:hypothetical protein
MYEFRIVKEELGYEWVDNHSAVNPEDNRGYHDK